MRYLLAVLIAAAITTPSLSEEHHRIERSVVVKWPDPYLEHQPSNRVQQTQQAVQPPVQYQPAPQPQPQYQPQPQIIYVQPQPQPQVRSAVNPQWENYIRYRLWFNANYERRGLLFPRYVRRDPRETLMTYMLYSRMMQ